ncbi:ParB-like nuclease domain-containing protein [Nocardia ninae]
MRLIDGRHRLRAAQLRGDTHITAVFFDGSEADAFVLAVKANTTHGLPLTLGERTAAAHRILLTHPQWSDSAVASCTGLAAKTVSGIRRSSKEIPKLNSRVGRDGRVRPVDASAGRERAAQLIIEQPGASLREVARKAGVSPATVQDVRDRLQRGESALSSRKKRRSQPARVVDREPETLAELIQGLQRDPSIRFSDSGRKLLRLLSSQPLQLEHWETVIADVPTHRNDAVTRIAMQHAANWERFANKLAQRQDEQRRTAG